VWLAIAVAISGLSKGRPWLWIRVGVAILLAESISGALKVWVKRDRPPLFHPVPKPLLEAPSTYSFPSGHATVSFACATVLALAVPRLRVPLFALAALISFSRVYVGVHYPFDVLAGAALGLLLGVGIAIALRTLAAALRRSEPRMRRG
jgi:undecaprenyl-diphosphatase